MKKIENILMEQGQLTNMNVTSRLYSIWSCQYVISISCDKDNNNNNNKGTKRHDNVSWHVWYPKYGSEKRSYISIAKHLQQKCFHHNVRIVMMIIDIYYEIYENCLVLIDYVSVAWPASQWVRKTYVHVYCMSACW